MQMMNATNFRRGLFAAIEQTVRYNEPIHITSRTGNVVLLSEEDYNDMMATIELGAVPGMEEKIVQGLKTPLNDCVPADEVKW